jgi:hypothetical protein
VGPGDGAGYPLGDALTAGSRSTPDPHDCVALHPMSVATGAAGVQGAGGPLFNQIRVAMTTLPPGIVVGKPSGEV